LLITLRFCVRTNKHGRGSNERRERSSPCEELAEEVTPSLADIAEDVFVVFFHFYLVIEAYLSALNTVKCKYRRGFQ